MHAKKSDPIENALDILSDGTPITDLVDREKREVATRVFSDPEVYRLELDRIFSKSWIVLGHESEIPNVGDFVTRKMAEDPVILTRQKDGTVTCVLNVCPHRGAIVCREESGNSAVFRCIYHGWIFNHDGSFRGAPFKEEMYPDGLDTVNLTLRKARVEMFCGIIFANWDESAPSLDDYLGDAKFYLNTTFGRTEAGVEVIGAPQRYVINANWKTAAEQFGGDAYHAGQLHRSLGALSGGDPANPRDWQMHAPKVSIDNGHNVLCFDLSYILDKLTGGKKGLSVLEKLNILPPSGLPQEMLPEMLQHLSEQELEFIATTPQSAGGMFPNVGVWCMYNPGPDQSLLPFMSFRSYVPIGPDKFEFCMWVLVAKGASEEYRRTVRRSTSFMQGASGFIESDDAEVWPAQTMAAQGHVAGQTTLKYWALSGDSRPEGWPGGGRVHTGFARDDTQWNWWQAYFDRMEQKV
jgi:phenylpropionate dioxygenase-like ring-hydroxylating dioxygenase large terminal subunit